MDLHEKEDVIRFVYNLETCGGPGDIEESLSMREGSRGTVAWIQQKASIASVFTPDLGWCRSENIAAYNLITMVLMLPCVEDTVYRVPKVLFRCREGRHTRQEKHSHLF